MSGGLLEGMVFVEVADPLTEYGGLILAGLGAEVVLIEPPGGANTRSRGPFFQAGDPSRRSIPFIARNLGKRSIVVDPASEEDAGRLGELLGCATGVLTTDRAALHDLVKDAMIPVVTITDPRNVGGVALIAFAQSAGLSSSGWPHQPPTNAPSYFAQDAAGIYASVMLLVAARQWAADGGRTRYEIRTDEAAVAAATPWTRPLCSYDRSTAGQGAHPARLGAGPHPVIRSADGFVRLLTGTPQQWEAWLELLGRPDALCTEEWQEPAFRNANVEVMTAIAGEIAATKTTAELFHGGQRLGLTITPVHSLRDVLADRHVAARQVFATLDDPDAGTIRVPRPAYRRDGGEFAGWRAAPSLDDAKDDVAGMASRARRPDPGGRPAEVKAGGGAPLAGIRVLDLGVGAVVPEAASLMALLGADVIKVESRKNLDFLRRTGLAGVNDYNNSVTFNQLNLGVKSITVDMSTDDGREVTKRLVATCDILMENLRGDVAGKWGLSYDAVRQIRPDVIYMSSQGLGDGPYGGYRTYGQNLQAFSGITWLWSHPDDPYPVGTGLNHPDHVAGKQALAAITAALMHRDRTGEGTYLDCAQFEAAIQMVGDRYVHHQLEEDGARPIGNASFDMAPHGCYRCAGEDEWVAIAVEDDDAWVRLGAELGEAWCNEDRFATTTGRMAHRKHIDDCLESWTAEQRAEDVERRLRRAGVAVSTVRKGPDLAADAEAHESRFYQVVPHPTAGARCYTGLPVSFAEGERFTLRRPPMLGEHDEVVLYDVLSLSGAEVGRLAATGAIGV